MKYIEKNKVGLPNLEQWVKKKFRDGVSKKGDAATIWANFKKYQRELYKETRDTLLKEQGYLCAYCGRRIGKIETEIIISTIENSENILDELDNETLETALFAGEFKAIEHVASKSANRDIMFTYQNLVTVCEGGTKTDEEHCDVAKWDKSIEIKPTDADCESFFAYKADGTIEGIDKKAIETIEKLNLNAKRLKFGRSTVTASETQAFVETLQEIGAEAEQIKALIQDKIQEIYSKPKLDPYCFVKVYYFRTYLI
jgi:uncharacterized protein (TIGR02646 family)